MSNELTSKKQEAFAQHFALHDNASDAYRHAYDTSDMLPKTIWNEAYRLAKNPDVAARVEELRKDIEQTARDKFNLTAEDMLNHFKEIAFMDMGDYFDWCDGTVTVKSSEDLTPLQRQMITSIKQTKGNTNSIEVTFVSKDRALDRLATYFKLDTINLNATHEFTEQLEKAGSDFDQKFEMFKDKLAAKAESMKTLQ